MYVIAAAPAKKSLGATIGVSQMAASVIRTITPVAATSLFAVTIEKHLMGGVLVYGVFILFSFVALRVALLLPHNAISNHAK